MRYDDYQSLVKRYRKVARLNRFPFLERRFKRLRKRGHPRSYIKLRRFRSSQPILFDTNPFSDFSRKNKRWKIYFQVWYYLAYYMRKQLMLWASVKAWKYFHYKRGIRRVFHLHKKWYNLMYYFYDYRFLKSFYNVCFSAYSRCLSRARSRRLRKFVKKYIRSLRWDVHRILRKQRKYRHRRYRITKSKWSHGLARRRRRVGREKFFFSLYKRWWKYKGFKLSERVTRYRRVIKAYLGSRRLRRNPRMYLTKWLRLSPNFYLYRREQKRGEKEAAITFLKLPRKLFKKFVASKTFEGFYKLNAKNLDILTKQELQKFIRLFIWRSGRWYRVKRRKKKLSNVKYRIRINHFPVSKKSIYSLGLQTSINVSSMNPAIKYSILSLVDLTNQGNFRQCQVIVSVLKRLTKREVHFSNISSLVTKLTHINSTKRLIGYQKRKRPRRYNMLKNRKIALSRLSKYVKSRPALIPSLFRYVLSYKRKLILDFYKYKQMKVQLSDYEKDRYKSVLRIKIKKLRYLRRKLKKVLRGMSRMRRMGGTLKSWFIIRLASKYRKVLMRMRKYMNVVIPKLRGNMGYDLFQPTYSNYFFFYLFLYLVNTNYLFHSYRKEYLIQILFFFAYMSRSSVSNLVVSFNPISNKLAGLHQMFNNYLKYYNA